MEDKPYTTSTFKLEKGGSAKETARNAGALLIILGLVTIVLVSLTIGIWMIIGGGILLLGGAFAKS
jgi:hypothetical protein